MVSGAVVERLICHPMSCQRRGSLSSFPALVSPGRNVKLRLQNPSRNEVTAEVLRR